MNVNVINLNPLFEELKRINNEIAVLKELVEDKHVEHQHKIVDLDTLIKLRPLLGSKSTIYKKVHAGQIPHHKSFGKLRFNLEAIDELLYPSKKK